MPEPQEEGEKPVEKTSKILEFFSSTVKETKKEKVKPLTKIVIRRLPPRLTQEGFLGEFTLPPHDYFYFVRGDLSLGVHSFSRAYVNFVNPDDIFGFKEKYDDHPLQDEHGREYHAVVEWAPVQRVPKKGAPKKVAKASGTLETDPKYLEFLEKLEKEKNSAGNTSEYFMETDIVSTKEARITTTPLLEYIKMKKQQKIDMRNENRIKKREAEKERRRKEDEMRKAEKLKKAKEKEKQSVKIDEKDDEKVSVLEKKEKEKEPKVNKKIPKEDPKSPTGDYKEKKPDVKTTRLEKVEKLEAKVIRRDEKFEKRNQRKQETSDAAPKLRDKDIESPTNKPKRDVDERKNVKSAQNSRKPNTGSKTVYSKSSDNKVEPSKISEVNEVAVDKSSQEHVRTEPPRAGEMKSRFRYSEQRNRDREVRNQKTATKKDEGLVEETSKSVKEEAKEERKEADETSAGSGERIRRQSTQETSDGSIEGEDVRSGGGQRSSGSRKDPRTERRIRNKDRPSIEIYRPGMGKFSKQRIEFKKDDSEPEKHGETKRDEVSEPDEKKTDESKQKRDDDRSSTRKKQDDSKVERRREKNYEIYEETEDSDPSQHSHGPEKEEILAQDLKKEEEKDSVDYSVATSLTEVPEPVTGDKIPSMRMVIANDAETEAAAVHSKVDGERLRDEVTEDIGKNEE